MNLVFIHVYMSHLLYYKSFMSSNLDNRENEIYNIWRISTLIRRYRNTLSQVGAWSHKRLTCQINKKIDVVREL